LLAMSDRLTAALSLLAVGIVAALWVRRAARFHSSMPSKLPGVLNLVALVLGALYLGEVATGGRAFYSLGVQNEASYAVLLALPMYLWATVRTFARKSDRDELLYFQRAQGVIHYALGAWFSLVKGSPALFADSFIEGLSISVHFVAALDLLFHSKKVALPRRKCPHCGSTWNRLSISNGPFGGIAVEIFCYSCQKWSGWS